MADLASRVIAYVLCGIFFGVAAGHIWAGDLRYWPDFIPGAWAPAVAVVFALMGVGCAIALWRALRTSCKERGHG